MSHIQICNQWHKITNSFLDLIKVKPEATTMDITRGNESKNVSLFLACLQTSQKVDTYGPSIFAYSSPSPKKQWQLFGCGRVDVSWLYKVAVHLVMFLGDGWVGQLPTKHCLKNCMQNGRPLNWSRNMKECRLPIIYWLQQLQHSFSLWNELQWTDTLSDVATS